MDILILSSIAVFVTAMVYILCSKIVFFSQAPDAPLLPPLFLAIYVLIAGVAQAGRKRDPDLKTIFLLACVALKFLLPGALALIWFALLKNRSDADVLLFFVVYLAFAIATVLLLTRNLRNNLTD